MRPGGHVSPLKAMTNVDPAGNHQAVAKMPLDICPLIHREIQPKTLSLSSLGLCSFFSISESLSYYKHTARCIRMYCDVGHLLFFHWFMSEPVSLNEKLGDIYVIYLLPLLPLHHCWQGQSSEEASILIGPQPLPGPSRELLEHVNPFPTPWVHNTHPKIAVIVKERKWNVIDWKWKDN